MGGTRVSRMNSLRTSVSFFGLGLALSLAACTHGESESGGAAGNPGGPRAPSGNGAAAGPEARFFLPTGSEVDNTSAPTLAVDAQGGIHAVYPAYAGGDAYYAYCAADCAGPDQVRVVHFETDATVANAMIALDGAGRPQVLLATARDVHYASCTGDCTAQASWTQAKIIEHHGDKEVTGEAFALDPQGRPRFLMHTYVAYLGIGQKAPETHYVTCDAARCDDAASWKSSLIAKEIWQSSSLRFDADGHAKVASVVRTDMTESSSSGTDTGAYLECASGCDKEGSWNGIGFGYAYSSSLAAVAIKPAISLALTKSGAPRVLFLGGEGPTSSKHYIGYFECNADCTSDHWTATKVSDLDDIDAGIDLALDDSDRPRFVYTLNYNIGLVYCDSASCAGEGAKWDVKKVEAGSDLPPDSIFLETNCTVGAWFFHSPSIALTPDGRPRIGYQARDISGGFTRPDPTKPACTAGTDLTWSRLAVLPSVE
ncbi:MAG: hypothetical protein JWP87_1525 [Labilithrix sp.]|nr:hypothetical protein [Labilithrix sp.]